MAKKPLSEAQKAQRLANLEKGRAARKANLNKLTDETTEAGTFEKLGEPMEHKVEVDPQVLEQMMARMAELERQLGQKTPEQAIQQTAIMTGANPQGGVQGIQYKYPVDKGFYPDPTDRLYDDPELRRFALRENYIFEWDVEGVMYEKFNITWAEPRFTVVLFRRMYDEHGALVPDKKILVNRQIQHEDELVARMAADKLGLKYDNFDDLMNEVRYLRIRQWLLALFQPVVIGTKKNQTTTMVIDGKVVEVHDNEVLTTGEAGADKAAAVKAEVRTF